MTGFWYRILVRLTRLCGPWLLAAVSRLIACGYFCCSRGTAESHRFYAALFPDRGRLYHRWCTFRQYQQFTTIHLDRYLAATAEPAFTADGWERLEAVIGSRGGILLMSHHGNWEMAARLLKRQRSDLRLLLYMGVKEKEGVERMQKDDLRAAGITIIGVDQEDASPLTAVEGIRFLQSGGLVSMTGDIVWRSDQRRLPVTVLGHTAYLPEAPFVFALVSGSPLFAFFAFRTGSNRYHFTLSEPLTVRPEGRTDRRAAIEAAAQRYADILETQIRRHPFAWAHFTRFLHEPTDRNVQ